MTAQDLTVSVRLKADGSGFVGEVRVGGEELKKLGVSGQQAGRDLEQAGRRAEATTRQLGSLRDMARQAAGMLAGLGVGLGLAQSIRVIRDFEQSLSGVRAVTRASAEDMAQLSAQARQLGATTRFSAAEAAEGMRFLGMAGFDTRQILAAMPATLNLAAAASLDLGRSADIASNVLSAFRMEAEQTSIVADVMATAAASANTDVSQLAEAMKPVGGVASALGHSLQETTAALMAMAQEGRQGSEAGTGLRRVLTSLVNPTKDARQALKELGLEARDLNPATMELAEIVEALAEAGLDAEAAFRIFGDRGAPAILTLVNQAPALRRFNETLADTAGNAEEAARILNDNLAGDLASLNSALQELMLQSGEGGLLGLLRDLVQGATDVARVFAGMNAELAHTETIVIGLSAALGVLIARQATAWALGLAGALNGARLAMLGLNVAMRANPVMAVATAVGLLAGAYIGLRRETSETQTIEEEHHGVLGRIRDIRRELATATDEQAEALVREREEMIENARTAVQLQIAYIEQRRARAHMMAQTQVPGAREEAAEELASLNAELQILQQHLATVEAAAHRVAGGLRESLGTAIAVMVADAGAAARDLAAFLEALARPGGRPGGRGSDVDRTTEAWRRQREQLLETNEALGALVAAYGEGRQATAEAERALELLAATQGLSADYSAAQREELVALIREQQAYGREVEQLRRIEDLEGQLELLAEEARLIGATAAEREVALAVLETEIRLKREGIGLTSEMARREIALTREGARRRAETREQTAAMEEQKRAFERLVDDTTRYGADMFATLFDRTRGGWEGLWDSLHRTMVATLARMAADALLRPIVVRVVQSVAGTGLGGLLGLGSSPAQMAQAGGGLPNLPGGGMLGQIPGMEGLLGLTLWGGPAMPAASAGGAAALGSPALLGAAGGPASVAAAAPAFTLGTALGAAGLGFMGGGLIAQLMGGNQMMGSIGGGAGALAGAAIGSIIPGVGTLIGGLIGGLGGGLLGGLFGGGDGPKQKIRATSYGLGEERGAVRTALRGFGPGDKQFDGSALAQAVKDNDRIIAELLGERLSDQVRAMFDQAGRIVGNERDNRELKAHHFARFFRDAYEPIVRELGGEAAVEGFKRMSPDDPEKALEVARNVIGFLAAYDEDRLFRTEAMTEVEQALKALEDQLDSLKSMAEELGKSVEEVERQHAEAVRGLARSFEAGLRTEMLQAADPALAAFAALQAGARQTREDAERLGVDLALVARHQAQQIRSLIVQLGDEQAAQIERLLALSGDLSAQLGLALATVDRGLASLFADSRAAANEAGRLGAAWRSVGLELRAFLTNLRLGEQAPISSTLRFEGLMEEWRQALAAGLGPDADPEAARRAQQLAPQILELADRLFASSPEYVAVFQELEEGLTALALGAETQAAGFASLQAALEQQIGLLEEIRDLLNQRDQVESSFDAILMLLRTPLEDLSAEQAQLMAGLLAELEPWFEGQELAALLELQEIPSAIEELIARLAGAGEGNVADDNRGVILSQFEALQQMAEEGLASLRNVFRDDAGVFGQRLGDLTDALEATGHTILGLNVFLEDAGGQIGGLILEALREGLDEAALAERLAGLLEATLSASREQLMAWQDQTTRDLGAIGAAFRETVLGRLDAAVPPWVGPDFRERVARAFDSIFGSSGGAGDFLARLRELHGRGSDLVLALRELREAVARMPREIPLIPAPAKPPPGEPPPGGGGNNQQKEVNQAMKAYRAYREDYEAELAQGNERRAEGLMTAWIQKWQGYPAHVKNAVPMFRTGGTAIGRFGANEEGPELFETLGGVKVFNTGQTFQMLTSGQSATERQLDALRAEMERVVEEVIRLREENNRVTHAAAERVREGEDLTRGELEELRRAEERNAAQGKYR